MITFFTTAKPFRGHDGIIQRNALKSWTLLHPDVEVVVFGDEEGAAEVCAEFGLRHEPSVERHESGMKYLNCMFDRAQKIARHQILCYSNCDIILLPDFWPAFQRVSAWRSRFLLLARRWDTEVTQPIDFSRENWSNHLRQLALTSGSRQDPNFIDFFLFSRGLYDRVPPLVVGRSYWDHWLVWRALSEHAPVVDATPFLVPVHQNHGYAYHPLGKQGTHEDALALRNRNLCGDGKHLRSLLDATHTLGRYGKIHWSPFHRRLESPLAQTIRQSILNNTFWIRRRLGLRWEVIDKLFANRTESTK